MSVSIGMATIPTVRHFRVGHKCYSLFGLIKTQIAWYTADFKASLIFIARVAFILNG